MINIALIINSPLDIPCLQSGLTQAGYAVQHWTTGKQALEHIAPHPPDLIVLEADLLDITGYRLCQLLRTMDQLHHVPIIFLETVDEPLHQLQAFRSGATDYMTTPIDPLKLLVRIDAQLRLWQQQANLKAENEALQLQVFQLLSDLSQLQTLNPELAAKPSFDQPKAAVLQFSRTPPKAASFSYNAL